MWSRRGIKDGAVPRMTSPPDVPRNAPRWSCGRAPKAESIALRFSRTCLFLGRWTIAASHRWLAVTYEVQQSRQDRTDYTASAEKESNDKEAGQEGSKFSAYRKYISRES